MKALGVIPARFGSTRFPGKPLKPIAGKPLLQWVIEGAKKARSLDEVWVATDHDEIAALAKKVGAKAVMTDSALPSGSDRVFAAVRDVNVDIVVNIQGDEPLINGELLDQLTAPLLKDPALPMATLGRPLQAGDLESRNTAKIVLNQKSEAIYFSRFPVPYSRGESQGDDRVCLKHIGLYGFRKSFLEQFCRQGPVGAEMAEGLEQLRALYMGARIAVVKVQHESWGVDTPEDVAKVESMLRGK